MTIDLTQIAPYKAWINQQLAEQFPGVGLSWVDDAENNQTTPSICLPPKYLPRKVEILALANALIAVSGSVAVFGTETL